ncbi:MAG: tyrosine-type recombinase/integrase, partial [Proteobacteria bacterium]|nr:tyrosine-type recombinase/integrase [Pseudomonadota bacterium]
MSVRLENVIDQVSPVQSRRGAERYEHEVRQSLISGQYGRTEVLLPKFADFAEEFMRTHAIIHNKPSEIKGKECALRNHLLPTFGQYRLNEIDGHMIDKFTAAQKALGLSPKSINNHLIILRTILGKAVDWNRLTKVPKIKKLPSIQIKIDFLAFDEASRLEVSAAHDPQWHSLIVVALHTGLRLGELLALQWDDCDLVVGKLTVCRSDWQGHIGTPKSGKERTIPLNQKALSALKRHRHLAGPWVWCQGNGQRFKNGDFKPVLKRVRM